MNRQNNLKIILSTVIVLVISAIVVFTVVNWNDIVKKFQGAAVKADGIEKHERNTVPPTSSNSNLSNNTKEDWKETQPLNDESKLTQNSPEEESSKTLPKFEENKSRDAKLKDKELYGLEEPATLKPKDPSKANPFLDEEAYPMGNESAIEKKKALAPEKLVKENKSKKASLKQSPMKTVDKKKSNTNLNKLAKRVRYLEKRLGVKHSKSKKRPSLDKRIYRLEKIILKKKK